MRPARNGPTIVRSLTWLSPIELYMYESYDIVILNS